MLFALIMKETEWYSQLARLFNLRSLPVNWKDLLENSKNWHFPDNLYTQKFSNQQNVQRIGYFTIRKRRSCLAPAAYWTAQTAAELVMDCSMTSMKGRYFTKYQMCIYYLIKIKSKLLETYKTDECELQKWRKIGKTGERFDARNRSGAVALLNRAVSSLLWNIYQCEALCISQW